MVGVPIILNILIIFLFSIVSFMEFRRLMVKYPNLTFETIHKKAPYLFVLLVIIIFLFALNIIFKYRQSFVWDLPLWLQLHYSNLIWSGILAIFSFIFSLASILAFHTQHPKKLKIVTAGVLFIVTVQIAQWHYTRPVTPYLDDRKTFDGVILQTSGSSCAAASAANILKSFGIEKTEKEIAELFGTTLLSGTSLAQIIIGMQKIGFSCNKAIVYDSNPDDLNAPAIMFVDHHIIGPESHAVAYMGYKKGKAEILDPLSGREFLTKDQIKKIWHGRGIEFKKTSNG